MDPNEKLSQYVTLGEVTQSNTATVKKIDNIPGLAETERLKLVCSECFDKIREHFGQPLRVSSGYRCPALNKAVGGVRNSQHVTGEALDIQPIKSSPTVKEMYDWAKDNIDFDQLIIEGKGGIWLHVSYKKTGNRKQAFAIENP
jgi:hypothetical protein